MSITKIILENFRCFQARQEVALAPLTILVGENSTGKSSFLAAIRLAGSLRSQSQVLDFNEPPFELGAFEQIANYHGGRDGRAKSFSLGLEDSLILKPGSAKATPIFVQAKFVQHEVQPCLSEWCLRTNHLKVVVSIPIGGEKTRISVHTPSGSADLDTKISFATTLLQHYPFFIARILEDFETKEPASGVTSEDLKDILSLLNEYSRTVVQPPFASAPIRSRPVRTYDPQRAIPTPEGIHIPMLLSRTVSTKPDEWIALRKSLEDFSRACGLFESIDVRRLGRTESGPFQIRVKIVGPATNLMDVGYGVSQVLPILVDSLMSNRGRLLLLQQPEVHLHPRAQAELGTFLGKLVRVDDKRFVVETHSDYLIDRICRDVRDGATLRPEDVVILFFERVGSDFHIHPLTLDSTGNIIGAPMSYRQFFIQEEQRFLGM